MECVHILVRADSVDDRLFINLLGQGQLHQNAVDLGVLVQHLHQFQQLLLCGILIQCVLKGLEPNRLACFFLVVHIYPGRRVIAYDHNRQTNLQTGCSLQLGCFLLDLFLDLCGYFLAVNDLCHVPFLLNPYP